MDKTVREYVLECVRDADHANTKQERAILLNIAALWLEVALMMKRNPPATEAGDDNFPVAGNSNLRADDLALSLF